MGENNKVLKVTYGNFSCRLEGFDDSVETLKTVVAYFHDLAGPTMFEDASTVVPDLEALERAVAHDGDADIDVTNDEGGIGLRIQSKSARGDTLDDADIDAPDESADDASSEVEVEDILAADDDLAEESAPEDETIGHAEDSRDDSQAEIPDADDAKEEDAMVSEGIADALVEDEDKVDEIAAEETEHFTADDTLPDTMQADDTAPDDVDNASQAEASKVDLDDDDADESESLFQLPSEARVETSNADAVDDTASIDPDEHDAKDSHAADDTPATESASDKLQRIRAVVGRGPASEDDTFAEDLGESEPVAAPKAANPLAQRLAELAKRTSEMKDAATQSKAPAKTSVTPFQLGEESRILTREVEVPIAEKSANNISRMIKTAMIDAPAETDGDDRENATTKDASDKPSKPLILTDTSSAPLTEDSNDNDDDFDLHEEVASIERELAARPGNELARHGLPRSVEDAMSRILTQTDVELDLQETRDGRDAFAQLKAAVAATEAARQLGDRGPKTREVTRIFRDELGAIEEDDASSAASLKVVETTITDKSTLREVAPLHEAASRLREIAQMHDDDAEVEEQTFASFMAGQDIADLSDRLEAAAAFLSFVENEDDFSRPQLMRVVQSESNEEISREDGLRSFGRLLRQSRIVKLPNGRFQVADSTRFRPTSGHAAQG